MSDNKRTGLGLCDVLLVVFVVLKFIGVIDWRWGWVLAPLWIPILIALVVLFFARIAD
nr:hypothetical protein [uncultured Oscillibacter sp.]